MLHFTLWKCCTLPRLIFILRGMEIFCCFSPVEDYLSPCCYSWNSLFSVLLALLLLPLTVIYLMPFLFVDSLASIGRKRPVHYVTILSALLDFDPNFETVKGCHAASISYSVRTAFLGFLRCTNLVIVEVKFLYMLSFLLLLLLLLLSLFHHRGCQIQSIKCIINF